jgi:FGGY-family pentulose kinase/HAD superfamily hydrolase (TIGR01509 family)
VTPVAVPPVRLVIFDCDGVLVDSEPLAMRVLLDAVARAGVRIPPDEAFRHFLGRSFASVVDTLRDQHRVSLDAASLDAMRHALYETYRRELKPMAGLIDVLETLAIPVCVASSSQMERIAVSLEVAGLMERLHPAIYSASMVANGKPAPDLFLHAAREMGVDPAHCLVIEDSPAGIIAAKKAGMRVFAFTGGGHIAPSGLADLIADLRPDASFSDMRELPGLITALETRPDAAPPLLVAVDVGTGSARAGIVTATGTLLARAEEPILLRRSGALVGEHNSEQIWQAVTVAVRRALAASGKPAGTVVGLSFDATCSLVVRSADGAPLPVGDAGAEWDTIAWFDHRALDEAEALTATSDPAILAVGGVMSPEMELPKLLWLKRHKPESWAAAGLIFDLADFLAWRATGANQRSACTLTCKWNWLPDRGGWPEALLARVGLQDFHQRTGIAAEPLAVGQPIGPLSPAAAAELGLGPGVMVAVGFVDAHAGALGALGPEAANTSSISNHLVLVGGTSSCVMALSPTARHVSGTWGPYRDAVLPGTWLVEGGQSASGALLDHLIHGHPAGGVPTAEFHRRILDRIAELRASEGWELGAGLHVLPDFHGNRSPEAEPRARGSIVGLDLGCDFDGLCRLYWRTSVGLALGLRRIVAHLRQHGYGTATLRVAGGHVHNPLLMELYAEATGCRLLEPTIDVTLLGTAMAAAAGAGLYGSLTAAALAMQQPVRTREPNGSGSERLARDYQVFEAMLRHRQEIEAIERG